MYHRLILILSCWVLASSACANAATVLEVKAGKTAIVKHLPSGEGFERLSAGTRVTKIGDAPRYYKIRLADGRIGWSYKGNLFVVDDVTTPDAPSVAVSKELLLGRSDVLKIMVLDVEVGDSTLILCPEEDGKRDVILIDTGENDSGTIRDTLVGEGFLLPQKPIDRFIITHYDGDHMGDAWSIVPISKVVYDHGDNIKVQYKVAYQALVNKPSVDRRLMTLGYHETFFGGVTIECVAVNQATDFDPDVAPSPRTENNPNSIALIISWEGFDDFTGGDLTKKPERSLANGPI